MSVTMDNSGFIRGVERAREKIRALAMYAKDCVHFSRRRWYVKFGVVLMYRLAGRWVLKYGERVIAYRVAGRTTWRGFGPHEKYKMEPCE